MKNFKKGLALNRSKGFTLIELLIVIALLGALAVALLAALDPLEQIKKGTDTGVRNTVAEISGSFIRYASVKGGSLPFSTLVWGSVGQAGTARNSIQSVIDAGELKQDFFTLSSDQLDKIFITAVNNTGTQRAMVCFQPGSKSFRVDANTKFGTIAGQDGTMTSYADCTAGGTSAAGGQSCFWCVQ
ncbi:MAG: prepilin-type N-terminal cleavage/methylation domain-containing protein [Patescibacteria group bacterium]